MAVRYKAYPAYKDSGVEWLGEIPEGWTVGPLKRVIVNIDGGAWGQEPDGLSDTYVLRSTEQTINGDWRVINPALRKLTATEKLATLLKENDLLMTKSSGSSLHIGKTTLVDKDIEKLKCGFSNFMQRIRLVEGVCSKFYWYVLNNELARKQLDFLSNSTTGLANLNASVIGEIIFPLVSYEEQQKIAQFLDYETAKIDALIAKQEQLIELLKEKRQAVISHAVTKGLNPDAPMKDSGVEWLGQVPEHWSVKRLKDFSTIVGGYAFKSTDFQDTGYPVVKISNVSHLEIDWSDKSYLPPLFAEEYKEYIAPKGALVFAMTRPVIKGGIKVFMMNEECAPLINQRVGFMKVKSHNTSMFLLRASLSAPFLAQFINNMTVTNQPNISGEGIGNVKVSFPPRAELLKINNFLNDIESKYGLLITKNIEQIQLLQERKTALISAAVTGKIDVRDWQPPSVG